MGKKFLVFFIVIVIFLMLLIGFVELMLKFRIVFLKFRVFCFRFVIIFIDIDWYFSVKMILFLVKFVF